MSETASLDVRQILEKAQPQANDVEAVRNRLCTDTTVRKAVAALVASLPSKVAAAKSDPSLALKKGLALWAYGRETEAADWLSHASSKVGTLFAGRALTSTGRPGQAVVLLETLADDPRAAAALAEAHAALGDPDAAEALLGQVEDAATKAYIRGRCADLRGERQQATDFYEKAVEADETHSASLFRLAYNEHIYGDERQAVELYKSCLDTPCPPVNAYLNLGNLYEDLEEFSKARECYATVLDGDGAHTRARMFTRDAAASVDMFYDEDMERRADRRSQVMRLPVTDFELSVRSRNCLAKMGVRTLGDLIQRTEPELLSYKNFGETSLQEIKDILAQKGLRLGMGREEVTRDDQARSILESIGVGDDDRRAILDRPLGDLELSVRSRHCMNVLGMKSVGDLVERTETELMTIKNFGQTSLNEVKQKLAELGVALTPSSSPS